MSKKSKVWKIWTLHDDTAETDDFFHTNAMLGIFSGGKGSALAVFLRLVYNSCFYACTLQGPGTKKGFVCAFATSCEISFRDIPQIIRVSNTIPWPNISKILFVNKKLSGRWAYHIQLICYKFSCPEHRCLKLASKRIETYFRQSRWMPVIGVLTKVVLQISVTPFPGFHGWVGCVVFGTLMAESCLGIRNLLNMATIMRIILEEIRFFCIYGIVHLFFHFG